MKHLAIVLTIALALISAPSLASAGCGNCSVEHKAEGGQKVAANHEGHGSMGSMDHSGMAAKGDLLELGAKAEKGIKASASLKDVKAAMAKMGMKTTHHFMVAFADEKSGKPLDKGTVAVKIVDPAGTVTGPMELMGMSGHFGADVILDKKGEYKFQVGSKLADGTARQYEFKTTIK